MPSNHSDWKTSDAKNYARCLFEDPASGWDPRNFSANELKDSRPDSFGKYEKKIQAEYQGARKVNCR